MPITEPQIKSGCLMDSCSEPTLQVLRRGCSSMLSDLGMDGKVVTDQLGHTLDVSQNVYTRVAFDRQKEAVNRLDSALRVPESGIGQST